MKYCYFLIVFLLIAACGEQRPVKNCHTFNEAPDPAPDTAANWNRVPATLNVSMGSTDVRYAKSSVPVQEKTMEWKGSGWRGERLSAQAILWSAENISQIECTFSDFQMAENQAVMKAGIAQARFVRYVLTDIFEPGCGHRKPEDFPVSLAPDMLDSIACFDLEARTTRPVWLSFDIPHDATPGIYTGSVSIHARNQKVQKLNISIEVLPQTLPPAADWQFHLDLWQHPSNIARIHGVNVWSEEHWLLITPLMKMLASAGQKVITATLNKDPWNVQTYDPYADMILWTYFKNGTWMYDYTVFDRWVTLMMDLGIKKMINCYSMLPWNNELHYKNALTGGIVTVNAAPGSKEFEAIWTPFLTDFCKHLKEKGWLEITNIAMDERSPKEMKAALDLLGRVAPELGVSLADNHKSYRQYPYLKDICVAFGAEFDAADLEYRRSNGLTSTFYVCCSDKFPNVFTFSDPAEATYAGWYAAAAGLDGFLRWAYNSWVEDPVIDSRFRTWPAGDTYIVYPGNRSSIRFERLREGIQDFEKIRILGKRFRFSSQSDDAVRLAKLERELAKFNVPNKPTTPTSQMVNDAKSLLDEFSRQKGIPFSEVLDPTRN